MFNVIMRHYDWNEPTGSMDLGRMFENTEDAVTAQFKDGALPAFDRLKRLPCLFIPEGIQEQTCRVGNLNGAKIY